MYQLIAYIKFLYRSKNQHGVHSPFVYDLVTKCFYDKIKYPEYKQIRAYRKSLKQDPKTIEITDSGSGSRVFKTNSRKVSDILKISSSRYKQNKLLFRLVDYLKPNNILELGTNLGVSTYAMALGQPVSGITSIEGCPNTLSIARKQLMDFNVSNCKLLNGTFSETLLTLDDKQWDFIFFDGHHNKTATLHYFEKLLPKIHNDSLIILDDIYWSKEMTEAWTTIKNHPEVSVTVDLFFWGLVFFRKEQRKEHFTIRV